MINSNLWVCDIDPLSKKTLQKIYFQKKKNITKDFSG